MKITEKSIYNFTIYITNIPCTILGKDIDRSDLHNTKPKSLNHNEPIYNASSKKLSREILWMSLNGGTRASILWLYSYTYILPLTNSAD